MSGVFNDTYAIFLLLFYQSICCWCSFELPRLVEAIQMSINKICFYKVDKGTPAVM